MKILLTGGAGFIGSEFVRQAVKQDFEVTVIDKLSYAGDLERLRAAEKNFVFHRIDIADREAVHRGPFSFSRYQYQRNPRAP